MTDRDRDRDVEPAPDLDAEAMRAFLSALSRVAAPDSTVWSDAGPSRLADLWLELDPADRERLASMVLPLASAADPPPTEGMDIGATAAHEPAPMPPASPSPAPPSGEGLTGRYELVNLHARGGIGQVWRARDRQLSREVAIKELQARYVDREDLRARFLVEAEITGRLEHPGIVPVYSMGTDDEGRPYYAMRFVRGHSLSTVIRGYHRSLREAEAAGADPSRAWGLEFRQLLQRFVGACETLDYAHGQGCIHRDLKPGNIMVGPYGETLVVDWGLGKILGDGPEPTPPPSTDSAERPSATPISATRPGDRIGTPQYMSPEQALGALERVGPRSDVYGLGATLFELLTGRPPFDEMASHEVTVAVLRGAPPPRSVLATIPPALNAICARAMAFRPEDRYASAGELARDLENWLADEPVSARAETLRERLARWIRRHRGRVMVAGVAMMVVSLVAVAAAAAIGRSWRNESAARALAEANFESAQQTVDKYLTRISQDELLSREDSIDMRRLRHDLLTEALTYYERFARDHARDDRLRHRLALAYENVGVIRLQIATPAEAIVSLEASVAIWDELLARHPAGSGPRAERGWTLSRLGEARLAAGRANEALEAFEDSVAALRLATASPPAMEQWGEGLADGLINIAAIRAGKGRSAESLAAVAEARRVLEAMLAGRPGSVRLGAKLAEVANNQGYEAQTRGDAAEALRRYEECETRCRAMLAALPADAPRPIRLLELMGLGAANSGDVLTGARRFAEAERANLRALDLRRELAASHPTVVRHRRDLGQTLAGLGSVRRQLGRYEEALASLGEARNIFEGLIASNPGNADSRTRLARTLNTLGCVLGDRREHREAIPVFQRVVDEYQRAIDLTGEAFELRFGRAIGLANIAGQWSGLGETETAMAAWDQSAEAVLETLRDPDAGPWRVPGALASARTAGDVRLAAGDADGALARYEKVADAARERLAGDDPTRIDALAELDLRRAAAMLAAGRVQPAGEILDRLAVELRKPRPKMVGTLSDVLWLRGRLANEAGREADARAATAARAALWTAANVDALVDRASSTARKTGILGHGRAIATPIGRAARRLDAALVADDLRLALSLGLADRVPILADGDLMDLLDGPEGRDVRDELAFPDFPFAPEPR